MRKSTKRFLLATGVIVCILILLIAAVGFKFKAELSKMHPLETKEIASGVYAINDGIVNMFLVRGSSGFIAVDAGNDTKNIKQEMKKLDIDPEKVTAVFLTHSDSDHIAAVAIFKNATIYLPKEEEQMINGTTARFYVTKNKINFKYKTFADNEIIKTSDLEIKGIATPGHTPGAMCYLIDNKFLFTGDSLSLQSGKANLFSKLINMDNETQLKSLRTLAQINGVKYIFTAHHGYSDNFAVAFADIK
jgi:hydroxyacylglutathione hydrolase